jgi:hypothetical protein
MLHNTQGNPARHSASVENSSQNASKRSFADRFPAQSPLFCTAFWYYTPYLLGLQDFLNFP